FREGKIDTGLISRRESEFTKRPEGVSTKDLQAVANVFLVRTSSEDSTRPVEGLLNWRLNSARAQRIRLAVNGEPTDVELGEMTYRELGERLSSGHAQYAPGRIFLTEEGTTF